MIDDESLVKTRTNTCLSYASANLPILSGARIQKKFGGVSCVPGPTFVVFVFDKKSQQF